MKEININKLNGDYLIQKHLQNKLSIKSETVKKYSFEQVLESIKNKEENLKFSKHAIERMNERNINLGSEEIAKIKDAVDKAQNKGVREALILMEKVAFIASVKNRTIITTITSEQLKENVFTNIDGAVVI